MRKVIKLLVASLLVATTSPALAQTLYLIDSGSVVQLDVTSGATTSIGSGASTIAIDPDDGFVFYFQGSSLIRTGLDGTGTTNLVTYPFGTEALVAQTAENRVYWLNTFNGQLVSADYNGLNTDVEGGAFWWSGLDFDPVGNMRYYTLDGPVGVVAESTLDGNGEAALAGPALPEPQDCRVDAVNGQVYWREGGNIRRVATNGTGEETVIPTGVIPGIEHFVLDTVQGFIYVSAGGSVWQTALDGSTPVEIYSTGTNIMEMAIAPGVASTGPLFVRGDVNTDGLFDIADPVSVLNILFIPGTPVVNCLDAMDINDDGSTDIGDAVYALSALFVTGSPSPPAPNVCGEDPTDDALGCDLYAPCP
ncbi:MAG: hypothetical protein AAF488_03965 [Planctomycetota bacterium]